MMVNPFSMLGYICQWIHTAMNLLCHEDRKYIAVCKKSPINSPCASHVKSQSLCYEDVVINYLTKYYSGPQLLITWSPMTCSTGVDVVLPIRLLLLFLFILLLLLLPLIQYFPCLSWQVTSSEVWWLLIPSHNRSHHICSQLHKRPSLRYRSNKKIYAQLFFHFLVYAVLASLHPGDNSLSCSTLQQNNCLFKRILFTI